MKTKQFYPLEHLTTSDDVQYVWKKISSDIKKFSKESILQNPNVLDLGGGMGEFSKYLNQRGIKCASLDIKDWPTNPGANQIKGDAYQMPFAD
jgi:2-polyprenyl-3-methyl-5-hydroxy-6-metoxy-1,4-benzoquinol methylase